MRFRLQGLKLLTFLVVGFLSACVREEEQSAPVVNGWNYAQAHSPVYVVRPGDTLYSIAWAFGLDYRSLAAANDLQPPYSIRVGQKLNMVISSIPKTITRSPGVESVTQQHLVSLTRPTHPVVANKAYPSLAPAMPMAHHFPAVVPTWIMPARGKIVRSFESSAWGNKGINIKGAYGETIVASAAGEVVYASAGIRGYGNLIILKHNDNYLSAYAYNKTINVKEGTWVRQGEPIGTMGRTDAGIVLLHFEIRRNGQPVNPLMYLK